jgi:hypothetical protein
MREKAPLPSRSKPDEAWNIHSYLGGDPFVDHFILYALGAGGNSAGKVTDDQKIRSPVGSLVLTHANGKRISSGPGESTAPWRALSLEKGNCDNGFLDRRAAEWK